MISLDSCGSPRHYGAKRVVTWAARLLTTAFVATRKIVLFDCFHTSGTTPSGTESSGYVGPNSLPGLLHRDSHPDEDNKVTSSPTKTTPGSGRILCDTRITGSYSRATRRCHCGKVVRRTPPCASERGRQSPVVLESAERYKIFWRAWHDSKRIAARSDRLVRSHNCGVLKL